MKTLIYALACGGHGTKQLAHALTSIGLEGGHELFGMGQGGNAVELGDNRAADAWHDFAPYRYNPNKMSVEVYHDCASVLEDGLIDRYLEGEGFFVDIGMHLADMWPFLQGDVFKDARGIHTVRDGRSWVSLRLNFDSFGWYGSVQNHNTLYPWMDPEERRGKSYQEQCCIAWRDMHEYFLGAGKLMFKLEDFNNAGAAFSILQHLYPEATVEDVAIFQDALHVDGGYKNIRHPDLDEDMFWSICGHTMEACGYKR